MCLAHIPNLVMSEVFHHYSNFKHTSDMVALIRVISIQEARSQKVLLEVLEWLHCQLEGEAPTHAGFHSLKFRVQNRDIQCYQSPSLWTLLQGRERGWDNRTMYHQAAQSQNSHSEITFQLYFIKENWQRLMIVLTALEKKGTPLGCKAFSYIEDLRMHVEANDEKITYGTVADRLLWKLPEPERKKHINPSKVVIYKTWGSSENHPAYSYYKAVHVFEPRQLAIVRHDIAVSSQDCSAYQQS